MVRARRFGTVFLIVLGSLLPRAFAQEGQFDMFYGEDMQSEYSVTKKEGKQVMSAQVFNADGSPRAEPGRLVAGRIVRMGADSTQQPPGSFQMNTNGRVWTPRVERLNGFDLSSTANLTDQPDFDWKAFEQHPAVIRFSNGYAVNLFAAKVKNHEILGAGDRGTYRTEDGKPLPARLIARTSSKNATIRPGDKIVVVSSASLMDADQKVADVAVGTTLEARKVQEQWVAVQMRQGSQTITGWLNKEHLAVSGRGFVERIFK
jgi:hypothetical protein